jgi:2-dehydro-3-deoxy-D-arabinonate dehydratase
MTEHYFLSGYQANQETKLALQKGENTYALDETKIPSFEWLLQNVSASEIISCLDDAITEQLSDNRRLSMKGLLTHQQIWAAGVTYKISEEARERESDNSTVYSRVYSAERPEVFWKSVGYETVSHGDKVGIRVDATWSVPEPELTVVFNSQKEVVGFTIGNDMSSRDIEGENPLYLPQAKVYDNACAIGSRIWLQANADTWPNVEIHIKIERSKQIVFDSKTSTSQLHRSLPELAEYLGRCKAFPYGVLLMTGTGVVPPDEFTLEAGDIIGIKIEPIGELVNIVHVVGASS